MQTVDSDRERELGINQNWAFTVHYCSYTSKLNKGKQLVIEINIKNDLWVFGGIVYVVFHAVPANALEQAILIKSTAISAIVSSISLHNVNNN